MTQKPNETVIDINWVCEAFLPISTTPSDHLDTRRQVYQHNAVRNEICLNSSSLENY